MDHKRISWEMMSEKGESRFEKEGEKANCFKATLKKIVARLKERNSEDLEGNFDL